MTLVCRLTRDPELRTTPSGSTVSTLRVAFTQTKKNAQGAYEDEPGFIDVTVFGKTAETCSRFLNKGRQVVISGRLEFRQWEGENGKQQRIGVIANQVQFLSDPAANRTQAPAQQTQQAPVQSSDAIPF